MKSKLVWLFIVIMALVGLSNLALATSWSTGQMNFQRTGYNPGAVVDQVRLTKVWSYFHPTDAAVWSDPVELNGRVFATFCSFTAAPNHVVALDINTGAQLWQYNMPSSGNAARGTPTAATVDTTGAGDLADLVYVAGGGSGGSAGIRCIRAADGSQKFAAGTGGQRVRYARPALADTNGDGKYDIVVVGTEQGALWAFSASTGAIAWATTLDAGYWILFGPSVSADGKVIYAGSSDLLATFHGRAHAVDATTGAILGTYDPITNGGLTLAQDEGYTAAPIYIDDQTVVLLGYGASGTAGFVTLLDRNANLIKVGTARVAGNVFASGAIYPEPLNPAETLVIFSVENPTATFGSPLSLRAFSIPKTRINAANRVWNHSACAAIDGLGESPTAVANSPDGKGVAAQNTDGSFAGADARLYLAPAQSTNPNTGFWNKIYYASAGFLQRSGLAFVDSSEATNDSEIVMVTQEGFGAVHAFKNLDVARARWTDLSGCLTPILLNVPFAFDGSDTKVDTFRNIGDGPGTYTVTAAPFAAGKLQGKSVASVEVKYRQTSPVREALANRMTDEVTATPKSQFFNKNLTANRQIQLEDQFPRLLSKSTYLYKQGMSPSVAGATPAWLTVTDLTGGGPVAPGGTAEIQLTASSAALAKGTYFADLQLTVAPNDPDPDMYGDPFVDVPITFIVGFIPATEFVFSSDAGLEISNFGHMAQSTFGFDWDGLFSTNSPLFGSGLVIIAPDTVWEAAYQDSGMFKADANLVTTVTLNPSPYVSEMDVDTTGFVTHGGAGSLRIQQYTVGLYDGAFCDSMIIVKQVLTNTGASPITLKVGYFTDWDLFSAAVGAGNLDTLIGDATHSLLYMTNVNLTDPVFGMMRKPSDDTKAFGFAVDNPTSIYNTTRTKPDHDSLRKWFNTPNGTIDFFGNTVGPNDKSMVQGVSGITINPGEKHMEEYIYFGWDRTDVPFDKVVWKTWLRQDGFYRGDVNTDNRGHERSTANVDLGVAPAGGQINVIDVVYLANFVLKATAEPWPFKDQGDVNADGVVNLADVIALANYVFHGTNVPTDRNRFIPTAYQTLFARPSIWQNADWR